MKKATFLRIAVFAVVVCALLVVSAFADDNAKIIRFDGEGNLNVTPSHNYGGKTIKDGILHIALTNDISPTLHTKQHKVEFPIPTEEQFTLLEYPYVKIKFKTNYPASLQFYLRNQQSDNNQYIYSAVTDGGTEKWVTAEMKVHTNVDYITGSYTGTSGKSYSVGCTRDGQHEIPMYLPSDEKPITVDKPFLLIKGIAEGVQVENVDYYFDLEYIAYFKNEADMLAYERDAVIMRFDGNGNTHNGADTKWNITNDGTLKFEINTSGANGKTFTLTEKAAFTLYEYPYLSIKFRTQWPNNIQYYATQQGQPANGKGYYCAFLSNTVTPTTNVMNTGDNNWYMTQFHFKPNSTSNVTNVVKEGEEWWIVNHLEAGSGGVLFPTKENPVTITKPFMQIKELATDLQGGDLLATEIEYIAYFKTEADMKAYIAEQTAMDNAVAALADGLSYAMHPAMTTKALALALEAEIEAANAGVDAVVNANDYANGTVAVTLSTDTITKTVTADVNITVDDFTLTTLGAQARADAGDGKGQGLRFGFTLDTANVPAGCTIVEYGAVIGKGGSKPVIGDAVNFAVIASTKEGFKSNAQGGITSYNAVITNIPEGQEGTQVTTRPYVTYKFGGADYTVYGEAFTRSVNEVLHNAINGWDK